MEPPADSLRKRATPGSVRVVGFIGRRFKENATEYFQLPEKPLVVISGGSIGAERINHVFLRSAQDSRFVEKFSGVAFLHQWGRVPREQEYGRLILLQNYKAIAFDPMLPSIYPNAVLYIGRAGAATICDLASANLPSVLIPYPHHRDKQQHKNAEYLAEKGCAIIVDEKSFLPEVFESLLEELVLQKGAENLRKNFDKLKKDGATTVAQEVVSLLEESR